MNFGKKPKAIPGGEREVSEYPFELTLGGSSQTFELFDRDEGFTIVGLEANLSAGDNEGAEVNISIQFNRTPLNDETWQNVRFDGGNIEQNYPTETPLIPTGVVPGGANYSMVCLAFVEVDDSTGERPAVRLWQDDAQTFTKATLTGKLFYIPNPPPIHARVSLELPSTMPTRDTLTPNDLESALNNIPVGAEVDEDTSYYPATQKNMIWLCREAFAATVENDWEGFDDVPPEEGSLWSHDRTFAVADVTLRYEYWERFQQRFGEPATKASVAKWAASCFYQFIFDNVIPVGGERTQASPSAQAQVNISNHEPLCIALVTLINNAILLILHAKNKKRLRRIEKTLNGEHARHAALHIK